MIRKFAEQLQVQQDLIERSIANAFANAQRRAVHSIGAVLDREDRIDHSEAAIVVTVPVDADIRAVHAREYALGER